MTRVLVLGGEGMLGHMVVRELARRPGLNVSGTQHRDVAGDFWLEARDGIDGLGRLAERHGRHDYLINCIGVLRGMVAETRPQSLRHALMVNALFPHDLARFAQDTGARVIHVSTDGVFRGLRHSYYEDDPPDALDPYGRSKALGEARSPALVTIRCSLVGPDPKYGRGLLEWLRAQPEGSRLTGYTDHWWNGVTSMQFAQLCARMIVRGLFEPLRQQSPVHHFCPNLEISKYELLGLIKCALGKKLSIEPAPAPHGPLRLVLATRYRGLTDAFGCAIPMRNAIAELAAAC